MSETSKTSRLSLTGKVVSNRMDKSIAVLVPRTVKHPLYGKYIRRSTRLLAHDENNECNQGDTVIIEASRLISRNKAWRLKEIISRAQEA